MMHYIRLYLWDINEKINRTQYWLFTGILIFIGAILGIYHGFYNIDINDNIIFYKIIDVVLIWPSLFICTKRLNDIGVKLYGSFIFALTLTFLPESLEHIIIFTIVFIGLIPSNYFKNIYK